MSRFKIKDSTEDCYDPKCEIILTDHGVDQVEEGCDVSILKLDWKEVRFLRDQFSSFLDIYEME